MAKRGRKKHPHSWAKDQQLLWSVHSAAPAHKSVRMGKLSKKGPFAGRSVKGLRKQAYDPDKVREFLDAVKVISKNLNKITDPEGREVMRRTVTDILANAPRRK